MAQAVRSWGFRAPPAWSRPASPMELSTSGTEFTFLGPCYLTDESLLSAQHMSDTVLSSGGAAMSQSPAARALRIRECIDGSQHTAGAQNKKKVAALVTFCKRTQMQKDPGLTRRDAVRPPQSIFLLWTDPKPTTRNVCLPIRPQETFCPLTVVLENFSPPKQNPTGLPRCGLGAREGRCGPSSSRPHPTLGEGLSASWLFRAASHTA